MYELKVSRFPSEIIVAIHYFITINIDVSNISSINNYKLIK